jgi:predicted TIM-barrel fold metal-dependent hydrolase
MFDNRDWLALHTEAAIEPELPIIDAHHHIYKVPPRPIFPAYPVDALLADKTGSGHNIVATVYVDSQVTFRSTGPEHLRIVGGTDQAEAAAQEGLRRGGRATGVCAAIVGHAPLAMGAAVREVLEAHIAASPDHFRGIRVRTAWDPDAPFTEGGYPFMLGEAGFLEGFAELAPLGLSFDAWLLHPQLPELTELARAFPDTTIILNHIASPIQVGRFAGREAQVFEQWSAGMAALATCPNVFVKIGALNMTFTGLSFIGRDRPPSSAELAERQRGYVLRTIDLFGPDRAMFESNFPVDMLGVSYPVLWNGFKRMVADFTPAEKRALFHDTAARAYRLTTAATAAGAEPSTRPAVA